MRQRRHRLLQDVHRLASRYHWSEAELFSLPLPRREAYLGLIDAEHEREMLAALTRELG